MSNLMSAYQYSTFNRMLEPNYDGTLPILKPKEQGKFGIGTFHALEGELVVNRGKFYHCIDRKARIANDNLLVAWASLYNFESPHSYKSEISFDTIENFVLQKGFSNSNDFVGISITGIRRL